MARGMKGNLLGGWAFLIGVVLALVLGLFNLVNSSLATLLVVVGVVVGLLNVKDEETTPFLMAGVALIIASAFGRDVVGVVPSLEGVLDTLLLIFVPATIIVAVKHVFGLARH